MGANAIHNGCGAEIVWAKKPQGGTHRPLEYVALGYTIDSNNVVHQIPVYKIHECDPGVAAVWEAQQEIDRQARIDRHEDQERLRPLREAFTKRLREWQWEVSLPHGCGKCGAKGGQQCYNLNDIRWGRRPVGLKATPHEERIPKNAPGRPEPIDFGITPQGE